MHPAGGAALQFSFESFPLIDVWKRRLAEHSRQICNTKPPLPIDMLLVVYLKESMPEKGCVSVNHEDKQSRDFLRGQEIGHMITLSANICIHRLRQKKNIRKIHPAR